MGLKSLATIVMMSLFSNTSLAYDKSYQWLDKQNVREVYDSAVRVGVSELVSVKDEKGKEKINTAMKTGSGVLLLDSDTGNRYILSAYHLYEQSTKGKLLSTQVYAGNDEPIDVKIVRLDKENDTMLTTAPPEIKGTPYRGCIANDYDIADVVLGVGYPGISNKLIFEGRVNGEGDESLVLIEGHVNGGNSGGPVYVFFVGIPHLVGIAQLVVKDKVGIAGIVPPQSILKIVKGTPLEDDYRQCRELSEGKK